MKIYKGRDARDEIRDVWRCTKSENASDGMGEKDLQWSCPRLLIVLLEVAQVDRLRLLDLIHVLKSYSAAREDLLDHKGAMPIRSEFASTIR